VYSHIKEKSSYCFGIVVTGNIEDLMCSFSREGDIMCREGTPLWVDLLDNSVCYYSLVIYSVLNR